MSRKTLILVVALLEFLILGGLVASRVAEWRHNATPHANIPPKITKNTTSTTTISFFRDIQMEYKKGED
jgi:hypothetical protein